MDNREQLLDEIRELSLVAAKEGRYPALIELMHPYLQHRPGDGYMWFRLGRALRMVGLRQEAEHAHGTALELAPKKRAPILVEMARLRQESGRHAEAEAAYAEVCEDSEYSQYGYIWIMRGANLADDTQLIAAEKCHRHALTLTGDNVDHDEAFLNLGCILRAQGRYTEAAQAFQSALDITPDYPDAIKARDSLVGLEEAVAKAKQLTD